MLDTIIRLFKQAGAKTEQSTDRDGAFSYHAESHAAGLGLAAGFFVAAAGDAKLLSIVYGAAVHGSAKARNGKRRRVIKDVVQEPHYAFGGVIAGAALGLAVRVTVGAVDI